MRLRPAWIQMSLRIHTVSSGSMLFAIRPYRYCWSISQTKTYAILKVFQCLKQLCRELVQTSHTGRRHRRGMQCTRNLVLFMNYFPLLPKCGCLESTNALQRINPLALHFQKRKNTQYRSFLHFDTVTDNFLSHLIGNTVPTGTFITYKWLPLC